jgi:hypothetical protein
MGYCYQGSLGSGVYGGPYLYWGGDNTTSGGTETNYVDLIALKAAYPGITQAELTCRANWFSTRGNGDVFITMYAYQGGTMSSNGNFGFTNTGGTLLGTREFPIVNVATVDSSCTTTDCVGTYIYTISNGLFTKIDCVDPSPTPSISITPSITPTITPSVTPSTTRAYNSFLLAYNATDGYTACSNYPTLFTNTYYTSPNISVIDTGVTIYQDSGLTTPAGNGFYSNGTNFWNTSAGSGLLANKTSCIPPSVTPSISISPSFSNTPSITFTPSITVSRSISNTPSITVSRSISNTPSITVSRSISNTPSITVSRSISNTPSITVSRSISNTPSITVSRSISNTPSISISKSISNTPSVTPSVTPSTSPPSSTFTVNIYAKSDAGFSVTTGLWTSTDNVNWTRRGSAIGTSCTTAKYTANLASGTTLYYAVADNNSGPPTNYFFGQSTTSTCPASAGSLCVNSVVITANTTRALTATEILC